MALGDGLRLAVGTLTAFPTKPPQRIDRRTAGTAMVLAPLAILPMALAVALVAVAGNLVGLASLVTAAIVIGLAAWLSRGLHLDGLSDTADGLSASFDRERALQIMSKGDAGPLGMATVTITLIVQIACVAVILDGWQACLAIALVLIASRSALVLACRHGIASAKPSGLGATVAGCVPTLIAFLAQLSSGGVLIGAALLIGQPWWQGLLAAALAGCAVGAWLWHCTRRFGGITGDVLGSCVEISLAVSLVVLSAQ